MQTTLESWGDTIACAVKDFPSLEAQQYGDTATLGHFRRVANELLDRTGRLELAQAGFLHGLPIDRLPALMTRVPGAVSDAVEGFLVDRQRLRDIDPVVFASADDSSHQERRLLHAVLARIRSGAAIVLLIVEQLDHLDPSGEGRRWLRALYQEPSAAPPPRLSFHPGRVEREHHLAFAESVLPFLGNYFGFAEERRFSRDLVALHRDRQAVERIVGVLLDHQHHSAAVCDVLAEELQRRNGDVRDLRWEWRHVRSCQLEFGPELLQWPQRIWRCGFATIVVPSRDAAYALLGRLHEYARPEHGAFRDFLTPHRNLSPYRALHTAIYQTYEQSEILLRIRIVPSDADVRDEDGVREVALFDLAPPDNSIVVYTPTYDVKYLPAGALVLNFAAALNSRWVARVESATVNDAPADVFTPLKHRDTVRLTLKATAEFLPINWWENVPESARRSLREAYAAAVVPLVLEAGRRRIREELHEANASVADHEIDTLVEAAVAIGRAKGMLSRRYNARDCLRQLGLASLRELHEGVDIPGGLTLILEHRRQLMDDILQAAMPSPELDIPGDLRRRVTDVVWCTVCEATLDSDVVGVEGDGMLTIHSADCSDAVGGVPLNVHRRVARRLYLSIEMSNRPGLLADICNLLRRRHVNVVDVAGRSYSPHWAAIRFELDCPGAGFMKRLLRDVQSIPGVHRVLGPDEPADALIERDLPPRRDATLVIFGTNPIVRNAPVTRDDQFYGRDRELREFKSRVMRLTASDASAQFGELVVLLGALQVGKTSFLLRSLREMHRERARLIVEVYLESREGESWPALEGRLVQAMQDKVAMLATLWGRTAISLDGLDLTAAASAVIEWTRGGALVIAVDEMLRLVDATSANDHDAERMRGTLLALRAMPRCMMVLSGPAVRVRPIHPSLAELIDKCQRIQLAPFGEGDLKRLIVADKLPWTERTAADPGVVARVFELTHGDPLWAGCLVHQLWEPILHSGRMYSARFSDPRAVDEAARRLMTDEACFEVRLRFLRSAFAAPFRADAVRLLEVMTRNDLGLRTADALATEAGLPVATASDRLRLLQHAGLARSKEQDGRNLYEIAAPLLATYLDTRRDGRFPLHIEQ